MSNQHATCQKQMQGRIRSLPVMLDQFGRGVHGPSRTQGWHGAGRSRNLPSKCPIVLRYLSTSRSALISGIIDMCQRGRQRVST